MPRTPFRSTAVRERLDLTLLPRHDRADISVAGLPGHRVDSRDTPSSPISGNYTAQVANVLGRGRRRPAASPRSQARRQYLLVPEIRSPFASTLVPNIHVMATPASGGVFPNPLRRECVEGKHCAEAVAKLISGAATATPQNPCRRLLQHVAPAYALSRNPAPINPGGETACS